MRHTDGFTLIELLIAMVLLALLSALLLGGLRLSRTAVLSGEAASDRLLAVERAEGVVRRQLQQADPLPLAPITGGSPIAFAGDETNLVFIAPPAAYLSTGGEQIQWLAIERGTGGARLMLRFRPLDRTGDTWPPPLDPSAFQSVVLLDGISVAQFSYFGRTAPRDDPRWWQKWDTMPTLPSLVRLALAAGGAGWPDLVVAPRIGVPANSGFLPATACQRGTGIICNY